MDPVLLKGTTLLSNHQHKLGVSTLGRSGGFDWNIAPLREGDKRPDERILQLGRSIRVLADSNGISDIYAPKPTEANGVVRFSEDLNRRYRVPGTNLHLRAGYHADGVVFEVSDERVKTRRGFWISSGDCPTVIVLGRNGSWGVTHAARNSILPFSGTSQISAIQNLMGQMRLLREEVLEMRAYVFLGISAAHFEHRWDHPGYGEHNERMTRHVIRKYGDECVYGDHELGQLNLPMIIRRQLESLGIPEDKIHHDGVCTFSDEIGGEHLWWSARRGDVERNAVFVYEQPSW